MGNTLFPVEVRIFQAADSSARITGIMASTSRRMGGSSGQNACLSTGSRVIQGGIGDRLAVAIGPVAQRPPAVSHTPEEGRSEVAIGQADLAQAGRLALAPGGAGDEPVARLAARGVAACWRRVAGEDVEEVDPVLGERTRLVT